MDLVAQLFDHEKTTDKERINKLPTFINIEKYFFQPQNGNQALLDPQTGTQAMHLKIFQWTTHTKSNLMNKFHNFQSNGTTGIK